MRVVHLPAGRVLRLAAAGAVVAAALTGCGGSGSTTATTTAASGASTTAGAGTRQGRFNPAEMQKIRDCLTAAGIPMPTPSGGFRSLNPSDRPTGPRPTGSRPSGTATGGLRGQRGLFADPQVRAALEACGITLPTRPAGSVNPGASPTATG